MISKKELRIWKHQRKKSAAALAKRLNGFSTDDILLPCMEWNKLHYLAGSKLDVNGAQAMVQELVTHGLSAQSDALGRKPLWYAARAGNDGLISLLLNNTDNQDVDAAFCIALEWHRVQMACTILRKSPTYQPSENTRNILRALLDKKWDSYKTILSLANDKSLLSYFLNHACWCGEDDVVKHAIDLGVSVNDHDILGRTPLHNAVQKYHLSTTKLLLEAKADPCAVDSSGFTPAHYVCSRKRHSEFNSNVSDDDASAILEVLVEANPAVLNCKNNVGRTPLHEALYRGNTEMVIFITKTFLHHLDTSIRDHLGFTYSHYSPLHADELGNGSEVAEVAKAQNEKKRKWRQLKYMTDTVVRYLKRKHRRQR
jgi:ankyrin repeat protein